MQFIEAFDTAGDAEECAISFFEDTPYTLICIGENSYVYYSEDDDSFSIWMYFDEEGAWSLVYCPPDTWSVNENS